MYHSRGTIYSKVASKPMCLGNINRTTVQNTNETLSYLLPRNNNDRYEDGGSI
jgi:hypothetical protein